MDCNKLESKSENSENSMNDLFYAKCRCCLEDGDLKNLWGELNDKGELENYGEMMIQCFALPWQEPMEHIERICDLCAESVRDAHSFKMKVLAVEQVMLQQLECAVKTTNPRTEVMEINKQSKCLVDINVVKPREELKQELDFISRDQEMDEEESADHVQQEEESEYSQEACEEDFEEKSFSVSNTEEVAEYLEVEYLEEHPSDVLQNADEDAATEGEQSKTSKWPRKKKKNEKIMTYKQYSGDDLRNAVDAVISSKMTKAQAATHYNIPIKTLSFKVKAEEKKTLKTDALNCDLATVVASRDPVSEMTIEIEPVGKKPKFKSVNKEAKMNEHYENIRHILLTTNATPIKGHWGIGYACCFCDLQFPNPADLKSHTLDKHEEDKLEYMKGKPANEFSVKLDITNLTCQLCRKRIYEYTLESLIEHLAGEHDVKMHLDINNQIIPFKFDSDVLKCTICKVEFNFFKLLNEHMNEHYGNYKCSYCSRVFVNKSSARMHTYRHRTGEFPCRYCNKVFKTKIRHRSHERVVHKLKSRAHKCGYCDQRFGDSTAKNKHETKTHGVEPIVFQCHACDATFHRLRTMKAHINAYHLLIRPFKCSECDKHFAKSRDVLRHMVTHTGERNFQCEICSKTFTRSTSLKEHVRIHTGDKRFQCCQCGDRFLTKVRLISHLKSKHLELYEVKIYV